MTTEHERIVRFGKHNGKTINEILAEDAQYLLWAHDNGIFILDDSTYDSACECAYIQHSNQLANRCENVQDIEF